MRARWRHASKGPAGFRYLCMACKSVTEVLPTTMDEGGSLLYLEHGFLALEDVREEGLVGRPLPMVL